MPDSTLDILIQARDSASPVLSNVNQALAKTGQAAKDASVGVKTMGDSLAQVGQGGAKNVGVLGEALDAVHSKFDRFERRTATRELFSGLKAASGLLAGELVGALGQADAMSQKLSQHLVGIATGFAFGGPAGAAIAGVGTAIDLLVAKFKESEEASQRAFQTIQSEAQKTHAAIQALTAEDPLQKIADKVPMTVERMKELVKESKEAAYALQALGNLDLAGKMQTETLNRLKEDLASAQAAYQRFVDTSSQFTAEGQFQAQAVADLEQKVRAMEEALERTRAAEEQMNGTLLNVNNSLNAQAVGWARMRSEVNETTAAIYRQAEGWAAMRAEAYLSPSPEQALGMRSAGMQSGLLPQFFRTHPNESPATSLDAWKAEMDKGINIRQQSIDKLANALRSIAEHALTMTTVTAEDMAAAKAGKYKPKWDEFRRQAEARATGTPEGAYGPGFEQNLKGLGMSAEEAAKKFADFSLFARPENIKPGIVDLTQVVGNMKEQIAGMAGKANLTKASVDAFWKSATAEDRANLAAAGITDVGQAFQKMSDPLGFALTQATGLNTEITTIPKDVQTEVNVKKSKDFDKNRDEILSDLKEIGTTLAYYVEVTYDSKFKDMTGGGTGKKGTAGANTDTHGGMAAGGPVSAGELYMVGEQGIEIFVPPYSGTIIPNKDIDRYLKQFGYSRKDYEQFISPPKPVATGGGAGGGGGGGGGASGVPTTVNVQTMTVTAQTVNVNGTIQLNMSQAMESSMANLQRRIMERLRAGG